MGIGGAHLAAHAVAAGLVDEYRLLVNPVIVGGGTSWLPGGAASTSSWLDERRFASGVVHLRYLAADPRIISDHGVSRSTAAPPGGRGRARR